MNLKDMNKRFQECNKLIKMWRYRWYILIPFKWVWGICTKEYYVDYETGDKHVLSGEHLWKILIGSAQGKMNWVYTMEEVMDNLKR